MTEDKSKSIEPKSPSPDELTKTKKPGDVQLTEEELQEASGGVSLSFQKIELKY